MLREVEQGEKRRKRHRKSERKERGVLSLRRSAPLELNKGGSNAISGTLSCFVLTASASKEDAATRSKRQRACLRGRRRSNGVAKQSRRRRGNNSGGSENRISSFEPTLFFAYSLTLRPAESSARLSMADEVDAQREKRTTNTRAARFPSSFVSLFFVFDFVEFFFLFSIFCC